jgi:hypothetical protein
MTPAQLKNHSPDFLEHVNKSVRDYWRTRADDLIQYDCGYYQTTVYAIEALTTHIHDVDFNLRITALWNCINTLDIDQLLFIREFDSLLFHSKHLLAVEKENEAIKDAARLLINLIANSSNPDNFRQTGISEALDKTMTVIEMLRIETEHQAQFTTTKAAKEHPHVYFCTRLFLFFELQFSIYQKNNGAKQISIHELTAICASIAFDENISAARVQRITSKLKNKSISYEI